MTATDESAVRLDHVTRHLLVALEEVAAAPPDRGLKERRVLRASSLLHHFKQRLALLADRECAVVGDQSCGTFPSATRPSRSRQTYTDTQTSKRLRLPQSGSVQF